MHAAGRQYEKQQTAEVQAKQRGANKERERAAALAVVCRSMYCCCCCCIVRYQYVVVYQVRTYVPSVKYDTTSKYLVHKLGSVHTFVPGLQPLGTAVPFWGQSTRNLRVSPLQLNCTSKRANLVPTKKKNVRRQLTACCYRIGL